LEQHTNDEDRVYLAKTILITGSLPFVITIDPSLSIRNPNLLNLGPMLDVPNVSMLVLVPTPCICSPLMIIHTILRDM
jgi:hypothetical protein